MNKNANSADVRRLTRATRKARKSLILAERRAREKRQQQEVDQGKVFQ